MPPSKKRGYVVLLMPVWLFVGLLVCPSVDHMVSADYLKNCLSESLHISHIDWTWQVHDSYWFWGSLGQWSRSRRPWMSKWFTLIFLKSVHHKVVIFHIVISRVVNSRGSLLMFGSLGQRSRSHGSWMIV
jgi:hypothetical protein